MIGGGGVSKMAAAAAAHSSTQKLNDYREIASVKLCRQAFISFYALWENNSDLYCTIEHCVLCSYIMPASVAA